MKNNPLILVVDDDRTTLTIIETIKTYAILGSKYSKDGDRSCCCI